MKRLKIFIVIAVMAIALLGSISIQTYYILQALKLNEEQFEENVNGAIRTISNQLNDDLQDRLQAKASKPSILEKINAKEPTFRLSDINPKSNPLLSQAQGLLKDNQIDKNIIKALGEPLLLSEKVGEIEGFKQLVKKTFENWSIDIRYNYGIYSNKINDFVIVNGNFVVPDGSPMLVSSTNDLLKSQFKVDLFALDNEAEGMFVVHFPLKYQAIWATTWKSVVAAILFTLVILGCFAYAVNVIFTQKKISTMKMDFVNNMTHEFKTPIATISLAADSIKSPKIIENPTKIARFIGIIKQENKRMLDQVEKVLQMALLEKKEFKLKPEPLDINRLIENAVEHIGLQVIPKGGSVTTELDENVKALYGDKTHLNNIIHNLLDNANKYSPENPNITITSKQLNNKVEISVKDSGIGMSKEQTKLVFDKFYRVHTGNLHDIKGFGLGLSYVKTMVDAHGGSVKIQSELGAGSTFTVVLPNQLK